MDLGLLRGREVPGVPRRRDGRRGGEVVVVVLGVEFHGCWRSARIRRTGNLGLVEKGGLTGTREPELDERGFDEGGRDVRRGRDEISED